MDWSEIAIPYSAHAFIVGHTGDGKSTLAKFLINDPALPFSIVYDGKHDDGIGEWPGKKIYTLPKLARYLNANRERNSPVKRFIYRPDFDETEDKDAQNLFFQYCFERGGTRVYTDEVSLIVGSTFPPRRFRQCMQLGRSKGLSMVNGCQRPSKIAAEIMTEATLFYIFNLLKRADRERMEEICDIDQREFKLPKYKFLVYNAAIGKISGPYKLNLNRK